MKTLVLCNGGYKSAFVAGLSVKECGPENTRLLFIDSGQKAAPRQKEAVRHIAEHFGISWHEEKQQFSVLPLFKLTGHVFTAITYAHNIGFDEIAYGAARGDKGKFNYELTHTHMRQLQLLVKSARYENDRADLPIPNAPCMLLNCMQIVNLSKMYNVPLHLTWNCENGGDKPCDNCDKCMDWAVAKLGATRKFSKHAIKPKG